MNAWLARPSAVGQRRADLAETFAMMRWAVRTGKPMRGVLRSFASHWGNEKAR